MNVYQQISSNKWKTAILMSVFIALILVLGYAWGYLFGPTGSAADAYNGVSTAAFIAIFMALISYFAGDKITLLTAGAKPIQKEDNPYVWRLVENMAITAGLPMPRVYIIPDPVMNAFATGRSPQHASIALTTGIINGLENEELEGVIAHELSHIKNYDIRLMTIIVVLVGTIALLADWMWRAHFFGGRRDNDRRGGGQIQIILAIAGLLLITLSPIFAELIKLAISRKREYLADASAVLLTRYADGLANALRKIAAQNGQLQHANQATAHLYISNPFGSHRAKFFSQLFSTHPPISDRIVALEKIST